MTRVLSERDLVAVTGRLSAWIEVASRRFPSSRALVLAELGALVASHEELRRLADGYSSVTTEAVKRWQAEATEANRERLADSPDVPSSDATSGSAAPRKPL